MAPRWLLAACSIVMMAISVRSASLPTQDTLVVANSDTNNSDKSDGTTEGPLLPIKMTEMLVNSDVSLRYAHTAIVTRVRNPADRSQQTTFHVLLPENAFITGFAMAIGNRTYQAYVAGKKEAKKIYKDAVSEGTSAGHISTRARDSNQFTVTVNVEPNSEAMFNLTYEELLQRRNGVYNHAINLLPGGIVPKLVVTVKIKESQNITVLTVPEDETNKDDSNYEIKTIKDFDGTESWDTSNLRPLQLSIRQEYNGKEATIIFTPDREEQIRLMQIYADKTKESTLPSDHWYLNQREDGNSTGILGQFVVQYDVARPEKGEILINDGYFAYYFAPQNLTPLNTYVIFVADTSEGRIDYVQDAMRTILNDLRPTDYFNIIDFHSNVKVRNISEVLEDPPKRDYSWYHRDKVTDLPPPTPATAENIEKAQNIVSKFDPYGGTDIYDSLDEAVDLVNKKFGTKTDSKDDTLTESDINTDELQPIIIMITTGVVSVGIDDATRIVDDITKKNSLRKAPIYTIAVGKKTNVELLRKISLNNNAFMRRVYPETDIAIQLKNYYSQIASPLLANITFTYPPNQVKEDTVTDFTFPFLLDNEELVLYGQLAEDATELEPTITAVSADEKHYAKKHYEVENKVLLTEKKEYFPLERLWAYTTIKKLLEEMKTYEVKDQENENTPEKRALELALKYEFVTPLTSLVVVKTNTTEEDPVFVEEPVIRERPKYTIGPYLPGPDIPLYTSGPFNNPGRLHKFQESVENDGIDESGFAATESISAVASLDPYYLQDFSWALTMLVSSTDSLEFESNGKNVSLLVSKTGIVPKDSVDTECTVDAETSTSSGARVCVYITRCSAARHITPEIYQHTYCTVQNKYAGFCCPVNEIAQAID